MAGAQWDIVEYPGCLQSCVWGWRELESMIDRRSLPSTAKLLLIPAYGGPGLPDTTDRATRERISLAHSQGRVIASACAGSAWIAATGLDRGRTITTHWNLAAELASTRADLRVLASELVIDHGDIVTAGGLLAWVDLGIHLIGRLWGQAVAKEIARTLVWDPDRGSQLPYAPPGSPLKPLRPDPALARALDWAQGNFRTEVKLSEWARAGALSTRTLERRWTAAFGEGPLSWLQGLRVEEARRRLEEGNETWEAITASCGYGDPASFRLLFERRTGTTPGRYRRSFGPPHSPMIFTRTRLRRRPSNSP